ncbi:hypothetical protein BT96DRAFT_993098 [Gymnopus androsaceus JB14]|uniref:Uncharacterized protein n=1 Tax=Gymnopus androsaceus JB14 TaxID=1447944 RepID=A0A6A4HPL1_9AGAR|nr:hypothetical protein BT96DRAFT_993098 [Gymnopus androsaceus JB14]
MAPINSDDFDLDDFEEVPSSPSRPEKQKATYETAGASDHSAVAGVLQLNANGNVLAAAKRYAGIKRLRVDQLTEVETFLNDTPAGREVRNYIKNIGHYVSAVFFSVRLAAFRGDHATKLVTAKLISLCLDLPENIEHDIASYDRLDEAVGEFFTQRRSLAKKEIRDSVCKKASGKFTALPDKECLNIYKLTQNLIKGLCLSHSEGDDKKICCLLRPAEKLPTSGIRLHVKTRIIVTVELCARIAIMRRVYQMVSGQDYWPSADNSMEALQKKVGYDKDRIGRLVKDVLLKDRAKYGVDDYQIEEGTPT